jgi:ubiquinone/menaquinone biosynthesis C-methylase UbiE
MIYPLSNIIDHRIPSFIENNGKLLNFTKESDSSRFYDELFSDDFKKKNDEFDLYEKLKTKAQMTGKSYHEMEKLVNLLKSKLSDDAIVIEIGGGIHQARSSFSCNKFKHYYPLDISYSSIKRYTDKFDKQGIVADATHLPFKNQSLDCIFTHTFLEHPLNPQNVIDEIIRVLKPGGIILHNDAWFCRWWHRYGIINIKSFWKMTFKEKIISLIASITEFKLLRYTLIISSRILKEIGAFENKSKLVYKKLKPNYNLHLGCDEDAASSIDPLDVISYYERNGFASINKLSKIQRISYPNKYIMLRKL